MSTCKYHDPHCPCQDGDACHYEDCGDTKAWDPRYVLAAHIDKLTARLIELRAEVARLKSAWRQRGNDPDHCLAIDGDIACVSELAYQDEKQSRESSEARLTALREAVEEVLHNATMEQMNCTHCGNAEPMADCDYVLILQAALAKSGEP
jgi:hypothetical protein